MHNFEIIILRISNGKMVCKVNTFVFFSYIFLCFQLHVVQLYHLSCLPLTTIWLPGADEHFSTDSKRISFPLGSQEAFLANDSPKVKLYSLWFLFICSFSKKCGLVERSYIGLRLTHTSVWNVFLPVTFFICRVRVGGTAAAQGARGLSGRVCAVPIRGLCVASSQWWSTSYHFALSSSCPRPKSGNVTRADWGQSAEFCFRNR